MSHPFVLLIFNKVIYSVLAQHQYIIINTLTWYCMDRVSSCSVYVVQPDTQCSYDWVYSRNYICSTVLRTSQVHPQERLISWTSGLVSGNTRTVRSFRPLRCCRKNAVLPYLWSRKCSWNLIWKGLPVCPMYFLSQPAHIN
jgi:hypothetical protein